MFAITQTTHRRVFPFGVLLGVLAGLVTATAGLSLGAKGCLIPAALFLMVFLVVRPRLGLALTVVAAINLGHVGRLGAADALVFPSLAKIFGCLTFTGWLLHTLIYRKRIVFTRQMWVGAAFLAVAGLSVAYAHDRYIALADVAKLVTNFLLYFLIANLIEETRQLKQFAWLILLTGFIASLVAVVQYTQPQFQIAGDTFFQEFGQHEGGIVAPEQLESGGFVRPTGTLGDPNWLALFLVAVLALNLSVFRSEDRVPLKLAALIVLGIELAALVMTHNRSGLVGLLLVLVLLIQRKIVRINTPVIVGASLLLVFSFFLLPRSYRERVFSWRHQRQSPSIAARWDLQVNGLRLFRNHWPLGVGQGNFGLAFMATNSESAAEVYWLTEVADTDYQVHWMGAHNMYLEVGIETGVIGLGLLLLFLVGSVRASRATAARAAQQGLSSVAELAQALYVSLAGFCCVALFLHAQEQKIWWILLGMSAAATTLVREARPTQTDKGVVSACGARQDRAAEAAGRRRVSNDRA
jgi:putative inorganic carbon (HCO3(-)) transporter